MNILTHLDPTPRDKPSKSSGNMTSCDSTSGSKYQQEAQLLFTADHIVSALIFKLLLYPQGAKVKALVFPPGIKPGIFHLLGKSVHLNTMELLFIDFLLEGDYYAVFLHFLLDKIS